MSRDYRLALEVRNIDTGNHPFIEEIADRWFTKIEDTYRSADSIQFYGRGHLGGGMSEKEAHEEIKAQIHLVKHDAKVVTSWQMLEEWDCVFREDESQS